LTASISFVLLSQQIAEIIKEDLWPNPLKYFNNVRVALTLFCYFFYLLSKILCFCHIFTMKFLFQEADEELEGEEVEEVIP
jgi:hypothetical protein